MYYFHLHFPRYLLLAVFTVMSARKPNIIITGTPGVGKTCVSTKVAKLLGFTHINISKFAIEKKLTLEHDDEMDCFIIDERRIRRKLKRMLTSGGYIVEYHSCGFLPKNLFDAVFVLKAGTSDLHTRLTERGYSDSKITENIECEIFQIPLEEAHETFESEIIVELENNDKSQLKKNVKSIVDKVRSIGKNNDLEE